MGGQSVGGWNLTTGLESCGTTLEFGEGNVVFTQIVKGTVKFKLNVFKLQRLWFSKKKKNVKINKKIRRLEPLVYYQNV